MLLAAVLPGCASFRQTASDVTIREPGERFLGAPRPAEAEAKTDREFAWLAEAAYGRTPAGRHARARHAERVAAATLETPCPGAEAALARSGWQRWPGFPDDGVLKRIERYHLRIEVWQRRDPPAVAVAFGGTVIDNGNDWKANLRWFLPGHRDEYSETVQEFAPAFVAEFKRRAGSGDPQWAFLKGAALYATGHSLGGGLAQQFAYALPLDDGVPRVSRVYAFDPSPVTGFFSVDPKTREPNSKSLSIDRVYERGEALAAVRSLTSLFVAPSASEPTIRGVRYALFYPADPISGHSMTELACRLDSAAGS
jgi:hypothetical protein